jgi:CDP-diacylglycerol---glycerol-3-phosphate 3-phosphatidyltransferase
VNLPNAITLARLAICVGTFVCLEAVGDPLHPPAWVIWTAFVLFLVAAFSDFLDGYFARKYQMVTAFGRVADPFADKVLISGTLVMLLRFPAATEHLTTWYVVIVLAREFMVTAIRGLVESSGRPFPADRLGKWKMVSQCWTVAALLTLVAGTQFWRLAAVLGIWVSLVLTVVSGVNYVWKARDVLFGK